MLKKILAVAAIVTVTAVITHLLTIYNLSIETDGNGDSAIVSCFGQEWFYGINGYEVEK